MREDTASHALARTAMAHRAAAAAVLADVGLHPGQEFLLGALLELGPLPVGQLADHLGVEQPTVTKMVGRMEPGGLVRRTPDPEDGRRTLVELTDAGRAMAPALVAAWDRLEARTTRLLDQAEVAVLRDLLGRVQAGLRPDPDDR